MLGARFVPVLGGENGNRFEARVNDAVATIYASGETNPIAPHGATITAWTLMNVDNPDLLVAVTHPLGNTAVVVVTGDPQDGWTLQSWDGVAIDPNPGLLTHLFVDTRALVVTPQTSLYDIGQALRTGDPTVIAAAIRTGVVNVLKAPDRLREGRWSATSSTPSPDWSRKRLRRLRCGWWNRPGRPLPPCVPRSRGHVQSPLVSGPLCSGPAAQGPVAKGPVAHAANRIHNAGKAA